MMRGTKTLCAKPDLARWDYFGERGLLLQERRSATCQALDSTTVVDWGAFFYPLSGGV